MRGVEGGIIVPKIKGESGIEVSNLKVKHYVKHYYITT